MIAKTVMNRVEISFWDVAIPLMTHSSLLRRALKQLMRFTHSRTRSAVAWVPTLVVAWGGLGLLTGFVIGHMGVSLW